MAELPHPWGEYLRLQSALRKSTQIDDRNWGLEAALNRIAVEAPASITTEMLDRAKASEARRERYRARLRSLYLQHLEHKASDPDMMVTARANLRAIRSRVSASDWALLVGVGEGKEYKELGFAGRLRARVLRLRDRLAHLSLAA